MKKGIQFAILGTLFTAAVLLLTPSVESVYQPRIQNEQGAAGAAAYLHELRANQVTGDVSQEDILSAIEGLKYVPESYEKELFSKVPKNLVVSAENLKCSKECKMRFHYTLLFYQVEH